MNEPTIQITGNLAADPELRYTPNGNAVIRFRVGQTPRVRDGESWTDGTTTWFDVEAWNALAENIAESLTKGSRVLITGTLRTDTWQDDAGQKRHRVRVLVDEIGPSLKFWSVPAATHTPSRPVGGPHEGAVAGRGRGAPRWTGPGRHPRGRRGPAPDLRDNRRGGHRVHARAAHRPAVEPTQPGTRPWEGKPAAGYQPPTSEPHATRGLTMSDPNIPAERQPGRRDTSPVEPGGDHAVEQAGDPTVDAEAGHRAERDDAWTATVQTLTRAVRLTHPQYGPLDFADILASALASVAANVGSVERLLAGRPGSWEAGLVEQLAHGTVGYDDFSLSEYRTEPVTIHLNVARLIEDEAWSRGGRVDRYHREIEQVYQRWDSAAEDKDEYDPDAEAADLAEVDATWAARYAAYAEALTAAVAAEAARVEGLRVPVGVEAITHPDARADIGPAHPDTVNDGDFDPLVWRLWCAAVEAVPLPGAHDRPAAEPDSDWSPL